MMSCSSDHFFYLLTRLVYNPPNVFNVAKRSLKCLRRFGAAARITLALLSRHLMAQLQMICDLSLETSTDQRLFMSWFGLKMSLPDRNVYREERRLWRTQCVIPMGLFVALLGTLMDLTEFI